MDLLLLLLAEDGVLDKADQAIGTADKLAKAGPVTLALVIGFAGVAFGIWQLLQNRDLREKHINELLGRETTAKADNAKQVSDILEAAKERRESEKSLLREMVLKGDDAVEALEASTAASVEHSKAIETVARTTADTTKDLAKGLEEVRRALDGLTRAVDEMRRKT